MKDAVVFAILLNALIIKVYSQPYQADSSGVCRNPRREFRLDDGSNLCCSKCLPGTRLKTECNNTVDSVCEECPTGQYIQNSNYSPNCFSCPRCKRSKGLQYSRNCSSSTMSKCECLPGMYCRDTYCSSCGRYKTCRPGDGVSKPGTIDSNVQCAPCPAGTFSDRDSYTDSCQAHTDCQGRSVVKVGSPTSDTVCEAVVASLSSTVFTSPQRTTVVSTLGSGLGSRITTTDTTVIASLIGSVVLFVIVVVLLIIAGKVIQKKGTNIFHPKTDANGNCEVVELQFSKEFPAATHVTTSFTETPPEQHCLLGSAEPCGVLGQSNDNAETFTGMECFSSQDSQSIGPLQSVVPLRDPQSTLSEPMTLLTDMEPANGFQSTRPPSPLLTSPQVNVNITFHMGNRSCVAPSIAPTDSASSDPGLPRTKELEFFSEPQQESGKQTLVAVQESIQLR